MTGIIGDTVARLHRSVTGLMWLISLRDLQFRHRRFTIAIAATALTFAMTLLMAGFSATLHSEIRRIVDIIGADSWIVAEGTSGPFTGSGSMWCGTAKSNCFADEPTEPTW
ncbi:MAG: hypothetical protein H0W21_12695 [Actinobacteria bacterium]|nr:hypothetical protein [Actinomycetota bacterium]